MIRRRPPTPRGSGVQGQPYAPYPLLDFTVGLFDAKESWLAPRGAWDLLENAHAFRGRIHKRRGYSKLGDLCSQVNDEVIAPTVASEDTYAGTLANAPICFAAGTYTPTFVERDSGSAVRQTVYARTERVGTSSASITGEVVSSAPGLQSGVSFVVNNLPIVPGSLVIRDANGAIVGNDLGNGKIDGALIILSMFFSQIDYNTGDAFSLFDQPRLGPFTIDYDYVTGQLGELLLQDQTVPISSVTTPNWTAGLGRRIFPGTLLVTQVGGSGLSFSDDGEGNIIGDAGASGSIDYSTGAVTGLTLPTGWTNPATGAWTIEVGHLEHTTGDFSIEFVMDTLAGGTLEATYGYNQQLPVMGIQNFFDRTGNEYTIVCDTRRIYRWNSARKQFVDVAEADVFTGSDSDFFWMEAFEDLLVLTNGVDPPKKYEPLGSAPYLSNMGLDFDGDAADELQSAKIFLRGRDNSGVYLYTREDGINYPQRARFTEVNDIEWASATPATAELYADANTQDEIIGAERLGDDFIVGFRRSFWLLRYTGDPIAPYEWARVPSTDGAVAKSAFVEFAEEVVTRGQTGIVSIDGLGESPIDLATPDIALTWNPGKANYSQAHHSREARQILLSYADKEDVPTKAFVVQYDDKRTQRTFARYDFPFHSIGEYRRGASTLWDDLDQLLDSYTFILDDVSNTAGFPVVIVGDRLGQMFEWGLVNDDAGEDIECTIRTTRLNPYPLKRAHLGYIDLLVGFQPNQDLTLNVYGDFSDTPYFSAKIDTSGASSAGDGKVKRRVTVNRIASWHSIEIIEKSQAPLQIDAVIPYFREAGLMRNVSV